MIISSRIPLHRLILSLSDALDVVHRDIADHQQRVAYIAISIAREMGMKEEEILDVFLAAALHDIGLITVENKMLVTCGKLERVRWHSEAGYEVLHEHRLFSRAAEAIRHHHIAWADGRGAESGDHAVPFASHIIALADAVERAIDRSVLALE
jgi:response regulator RpfG family c-di-GMP phosphodiesterase